MRTGRLCDWEFKGKYSFCVPPINRTTGVPKVGVGELPPCNSHKMLNTNEWHTSSHVNNRLHLTDKFHLPLNGVKRN